MRNKKRKKTTLDCIIFYTHSYLFIYLLLITPFLLAVPVSQTRRYPDR